MSAMSYLLTTRRQSQLEIRAHRRLLPRSVAQPSELKQLRRQKVQLTQWLYQPEHESNIIYLKSMLATNSKANQIGFKEYTEKRRREFLKLLRSLHKKENAYIKRIVKRLEEEEQLVKKEVEDSMMMNLVSRIKSIFCCCD